MRNLNIVEKNAVFKFSAVTDDGVFSDYHRTPYESAVAYFGAVVNDKGTAQTS